MYQDDFSENTYRRMPVYPGMPGMPGVMPGMPYPNVQTPTTTAPGAGTPVPGYPYPSAPSMTTPPDFEYEPGAPVETDVNYTQGYLKQQIGKYMKIEFLIGTNMLIDREGTLVDVGISYIIIREPETDDLLLCDIYSVKFVKIFY
jgi:hypothetical protein